MNLNLTMTGGLWGVILFSYLINNKKTFIFNINILKNMLKLIIPFLNNGPVKLYIKIFWQNLGYQ